jgi:hypothetical protein
MADRRWPSLMRVFFVGGVGLVFLACLLGILVTGPVVVRPGRLHLDLDVSADRLRQSVETLCHDYTPRDYLHVKNLDGAAAWIERRFRETDLEVRVQEYELSEGRYRNVIARRPGSDPEAGVKVLGAHYDAYREYPGANDNASGVAVLLELVRTLPDDPPRGDQYFVAFSTEEPPFFGSDEMGSHFFAEWLQERQLRVDMMIALDLVGYYSDQPGSQGFPLPGLRWLYSDRADFVAVVGDLRSGRWLRRVKRAMRSARTIEVHSFRAPAALAGVDWSDHFSFRKLGMPGVMVTDTAFMRYRHYHTPLDTPDNLDYERMAQLVVALYAVFCDPADGDPSAASD